MEALHATFFEHRYVPHLHHAWTVAHVLAGAARFHLEGRWYTAPAGSVFAIPPEAVHTGESATPGGYTYQVLYLEPHVLAAWSGAEHRASREPRSPVVVRHAGVSRALLAAHCALQDQHARLEQGERLVAVARSIQEEFMRQRWAASGAVRGTHPAVRSARSYIDDRWQDNFTLGELASAAGMSPFHLLRTFSDQVGMTPSAYRRALRVENARRRLRAGASCAQAALESGFCDQSHLNRHFKHVVGVTPGQYAAAVCD